MLSWEEVLCRRLLIMITAALSESPASPPVASSAASLHQAQRADHRDGRRRCFRLMRAARQLSSRARQLSSAAGGIGTYEAVLPSGEHLKEMNKYSSVIAIICEGR